MRFSWKVIGLTSFIGWLLGAGTGAIFVRCMRPTGPPPLHDHWRRERFFKDLALTSEQRKKVEAVFEKGHAQIDKLSLEVNPRYEAIRMQTRDQIRVLLSPQQQITFDKLDGERAKRFREKFEHGGPHEPPPPDPPNPGPPTP